MPAREMLQREARPVAFNTIACHDYSHLIALLQEREQQVTLFNMARTLSPDKVRARIATIVEKLPEGKAARITGQTGGEHMSLEVRGRRFGWFLDSHHGDGRLAINCKVPALVAAQMRSLVPAQFHIPKYLGSKGWIGLWLDIADIDWGQVEICLVESYRTVAPKSLLVSL